MLSLEVLRCASGRRDAVLNPCKASPLTSQDLPRFGVHTVLLTALSAGAEAALTLRDVDTNFTKQLHQTCLNFCWISTELVIVRCHSDFCSHCLLLSRRPPHAHCHTCHRWQKEAIFTMSSLCLRPPWALYWFNLPNPRLPVLYFEFRLAQVSQAKAHTAKVRYGRVEVG